MFFFSVFYDRYMKIEHMIRWLLFFFLSIDQFQYIGVRRYIKCRRRLILLILLYQSSSRVEAILQPYIHLCHYVKFELMIHVKLTKTKRSVNHPGLSSSHRPSICKRQIFDILTRLTGTISSKLVKKLTRGRWKSKLQQNVKQTNTFFNIPSHRIMAKEMPIFLKGFF